MDIVGWVSQCVMLEASSGDATRVVLNEQNTSVFVCSLSLRDDRRVASVFRVERDANNKGSVHPAHLHQGPCSGMLPTDRRPIDNVVNAWSSRGYVCL